MSCCFLFQSKPKSYEGRGAEPLFSLQPLETPKDQDRKKGKGGKTVSSYFKGQLDDLMTTLYKTEPHFIRCVVPNTHKQPGGVSNLNFLETLSCKFYFFELRLSLAWSCTSISATVSLLELPSAALASPTRYSMTHSL